MIPDPRNEYTANGVLIWYGGYRQLRLYLIEKFKICFWCKIPVKDYGDRTQERISGIQDPNDMATIDHTISRFFREKNESVEKVLACNECNWKRALKEQREVKRKFGRKKINDIKYRDIIRQQGI